MWIWFMLLFSSCTLMMGGPKVESAKGSHYKIKFKEPNWKLDRESEERSDYVWTNQNDGRILLSNSFCDEFQEQPLDRLAIKTFNIVDDLKIQIMNFTTFKNREAYRLEGDGKVDGVPVGLMLLNTRRNNCYFDFVSITPLQTANEHRADFEKFLQAVKFK